MKKKYVWYLTVAIFAVLLIFPLAGRIKYENKNMAYAVAVNYSEIKELFGSEYTKILDDYQESGACSVIIEKEDNSFNEDDIAAAKKMGFKVALSVQVDESFSPYDAKEIERLTEKYDIGYLNLCGGSGNADKKAIQKICDVFLQSDIVLVLSENKSQISNESFDGKNEIFEAAGGRIMRMYAPGKDAFFENSDYDLAYYRMLNSAYGRNTKFIKVNQIDKTDDKYENADFTKKNISRFVSKMNSLNYEQNGKVDFNGYGEMSRLYAAVLAVLVILMCMFVLRYLLKVRSHAFLILSAAVTLFAVAGAFVLPYKIVMCYVSAFAAVSPCFVLTYLFDYVEKNKEKKSFFKLVVAAAVITAVGCFIACLIIASSLCGVKYYTNEYVFRGVKICLALPVLYALALNVHINKDKIKHIRFKPIYLLLLALLLLAASVYILRSGNSQISQSQTILRNFISEILIARPRTKEVLIGWPATVCMVYFAKRNSYFMQFISSALCGVLCASMINTFCHSFASVEAMCLRFANGVWMGIAFAAAVIAVVLVFEKLLKKDKK